MATDIGTGSTITFSSSYFAEILSISWGGISRGAVNISHMGTAGGHTFMPTDLYDPGELTVELHLDQDTIMPIASATEVVTVTIPKGGTSTAKWTAAGFMTGFEWTSPLEDKEVATATIKFSDEITVS
jgi:hypothetical protein